MNPRWFAAWALFCALLSVSVVLFLGWAIFELVTWVTAK